MNGMERFSSETAQGEVVEHILWIDDIQRKRESAQPSESTRRAR
jgi:hypothetical protein